MDDAASTFTIKELAGQKRKIELNGRALPYRPFQMTTEQRSELTWLPGVTEATLQVFGPQEDPSTINGFWKDKFLGPVVPVSGINIDVSVTFGYQQWAPPQDNTPLALNGSMVPTAREAVVLFDSICRLGQLLEVTWYSEKRWGILKKFAKEWHNSHDVKWEMTFEWISRGEQTGPPVVAPQSSSNDMSSLFGSVLANLFGVNADLNLNGNVQSTTADKVTDVSNAIGNISAQSSQFSSGVMSPGSATRSLIAMCSTVQVSTSAAIQYFRQLPAYKFMTVFPPTPNQIIQAQSFRQQMLSSLYAIRQIAIEQQYALLQSVQGDLAGQYVARDGDDLRFVSNLFYGTPFEWQRIMIFNQLASGDLVPGQLVLVPKLNPSGITGV